MSFLARADVWGTSFSVHLFINEGLARVCEHAAFFILKNISLTFNLHHNKNVNNRQSGLKVFQNCSPVDVTIKLIINPG